MRPVFLFVMSFFLWHPILAQDTPQPIRSIPHETSISGARWHPNNHDFWTWDRNFLQMDDGNYSYQDHLQLWNGETASQAFQLLYHGDNVAMNVDWSAGDNRVLVSSGQLLEIWDALRGEKVWTYEYSARISSAHWNADFSRILFWSYDDGSVHIWDTNLGKEVFLAQTNSPSNLVDAKWSPSEKSVLGVITQAPGQVLVWDVASGTKDRTFEYPHMIYRADWNADGTRILIEGDKIIELMDVGTQAAGLRKSDGEFLYKANWSPDHKLVAVRMENEPVVEVWDALSGTALFTILQSGHVDNTIFEVLWSKDNQRILTHSPDGIAIWDAASGANLFQLPIEVRAYNMSWLSWSPDETKLVIMRSDSSLQIVTLDTMAAVELELPLPIPLSLPAPIFVWKADNSQVMLSGVDGAARVWDTASGKLLATLEHPVHDGFQSQWVTDAIWSPDQQRILTLGEPDYCGGVDTCPSEANVWHAPP